MFAYNHKRSEWKEVASMKTPRSMFAAVIHNGKIVVAGGVNEEGLTATCEAYDFGTNKYVLLVLVLYICNPCISVVHGWLLCCNTNNRLLRL